MNVYQVRTYSFCDRNPQYYNLITVAEGIDSPCTKDLQCQVNLRTPSVCSETEKVCKCGHGAHLAEDKKCYRKIGRYLIKLTYC